jgi:hypothetical protein
MWFCKAVEHSCFVHSALNQAWETKELLSGLPGFGSGSWLLSRKKRPIMKKGFILPAFFVLFAACSSPLLEWIETGTGTDSRTFSDSSKEITAFSFGVPGEEISIRLEPGEDRTIPIKAILPPNTNLSGLSSSITYRGASITPPGGTAQTANPYADSTRDFTNPQVYTVKAADGSEQSYMVQVYVKTTQSAAIIWCDLEIPDSGGLMAEGVVTEGSGGQPGYIVIHVPSGTDLTNLTARIAQTGKSISDDQGHSDSGTAVTLTGDFSTDRIYTVKAENGTVKTYNVTVVRDKSSAREIRAFSFAGISGTDPAIIAGVPQNDGKYPIVVTVPVGTNLTALKPAITHTGVSIAGAGFSIPGGPGTVNASDGVDFTNPVPYTVTAEDGQTREYAVTVLAADRNSGKQITGFYFFPNTQGAEGVSGIINETAKTIAVTVPAGTTLSSLAPTIYHTGVSISPISGEPRNFTSPVSYTVTDRNGDTQTYTVSVYTAARSDKAITHFEFAGISGSAGVIGGTSGSGGKIPIMVMVPAATDLLNLTPLITYTGVSITGAGVSDTNSGAPPKTVSGSSAPFTSPQTCTVSAQDGSKQDYEVTVIKPAAGDASTARIDAFYFNNPVAIGTIDQAAGTISVTVPWNVNLSTLVSTIHFTGSKIKLESSGSDVTDNPAHIGANFSSTVRYTVTAADGTTTKIYQVTVTRQNKPLSSAREITAFGFLRIDDNNQLNDVDITTVISTMPDTTGDYPIEVIIPPSNAPITAKEQYLKSLTPIILYKGESIDGPGNLSADTPSPTDPEIKGVSAGSTVDFNSPQPYTVKAEDGQTRDYLVSVRVEDNNEKKITGFYFTNPTAVGIINQNNRTITVKVPYGTNLSGLVPTVYYTGLSLEPGSERANNFSSPAVYTVRALNGTSLSYTVTVTPGLNSAKEISTISFPGVAVLDTVIGSIPGPDGKIPISVTVSQNTVISSLAPKITYTGVSITPPGGTAKTSPNPYTDSPRNFASPQTYRITAEDGSTKDYAVSVHVSDAGSAIITGFVFKPENNSSLALQAVGYVNQIDYTITVTLPRSVNNGVIPANLKPTITYIGASITPQVGTQPQTQKTTNPLTDDGRNFIDSANSVSYTVTAQDGTTQDYTVTVTFEEQNTGLSVSFLGITDPDLLRANFDQKAGILRLTINTAAVTSKNPGGYKSPYEWRLDGQKLNVSGTDPQLELHTSSLAPGQHEIVVVATGKDDGLHYTNKMYFLVHE